MLDEIKIDIDIVADNSLFKLRKHLVDFVVEKQQKKW